MLHHVFSLLLLVTPPAALFQAAPTPPGVDSVLRSDTLVVDSLFLGEGQSTWPLRFVRTDSFGETWMVIRDPWGGTFFGPSTMVAALGEEAVAFAEGREAKSVVFLPPTLTAITLVLLAVGGAAVFATPFFLYRRRYRIERDRRRAADFANHHLAEGREAERVRTAQDLHDGPVQDLHAIKMQLSLLTREVGGQSGPLSEIAREVGRVGGELRRVAEDLRPPALGPFGLAAALRTLIGRFERTYPSITVDLDLDADRQSIPAPTRLALFRIAQEALNNAARHGVPSRIAVSLRVRAGGAVLEVADDGSGYTVPADISVPTRAGHYGLVGMAERAGAVGAVLEIESEPGMGTTVRAGVSPEALDSPLP